MYPFTKHNKVAQSDFDTVDYSGLVILSPLRKQLLASRTKPFYLKLSKAAITDDDLVFFESLENLRGLDLTNCLKLTDKSVEILTRLGQSKSLRVGGLTNMTPTAFELIRRNVPDCVIVTPKIEYWSWGRFCLKLGFILVPVILIIYFAISFVTHVTNRVDSHSYRSPRTITNESLAAYVKGHPQLHFINLESCKYLTDDGLACLSQLASLQVVKLNDNDWLTDQGLAHCAKIRSLKALSIVNCPKLTLDGAKILMTHPTLQQLYIPEQFKTDEGIELLIRFNNESHRCDINSWDITDKSLKYFSDSARCSDFELCNCKRITADGIASLAKIKSLRLMNLRALSVTGFGNNVTFPDIETLHISGCPQLDFNGLNFQNCFPKIRSLSIDRMTDDMARQIAASPTIKSIKIYGNFSLENCQLSPLKSLKSLERLEVEDASIDTSSTTSIALPALASVRVISLCNVHLHRDDLLALGDSKSLIRLKFERCSFDENDLDAIMNLPALETLSLDRCDSVTDSFLEKLIQHPHLKIVYVDCKNITKKEIRRFRRLSKCKLKLKKDYGYFRSYYDDFGSRYNEP